MAPNLPIREGLDGDPVIPLTLDDDEVGYEDFEEMSSGDNGSEDSGTDKIGSEFFIQGTLLV